MIAIPLYLAGPTLDGRRYRDLLKVRVAFCQLVQSEVASITVRKEISSIVVPTILNVEVNQICYRPRTGIGKNRNVVIA